MSIFAYVHLINDFLILVIAHHKCAIDVIRQHNWPACSITMSQQDSVYACTASTVHIFTMQTKRFIDVHLHQLYSLSVQNFGCNNSDSRNIVNASGVLIA